MRSASMAWLFQTAGLQVYTLQGGYKAYRRHVKSFFAQKFNLIILSGMTGSGKTEILEVIEQMGEQIINLEKIPELEKNKQITISNHTDLRETIKDISSCGLIGFLYRRLKKGIALATNTLPDR